MEPWSGQQVALELVRHFGSGYRVKESKPVVDGVIGTIEHDGKFLWFRTCDMRTTGRIQVNTMTPGNRPRYATYGRANWIAPMDFARKVRNLFLHGKWPMPMDSREKSNIDLLYSDMKKATGDFKDVRYSKVRV